MFDIFKQVQITDWWITRDWTSYHDLT